MADRMRHLVAQVCELPPGTDSPMIAELADLVYKGKGASLLEVAAMYLKSTRSAHVVGAMEMLHLVVLSSGLGFAQQMAQRNFMDVVHDVATRAQDPAVRDCLVGRLVKWSMVYNCSGFSDCVQRMRLGHLGDCVQRQTDINRQQSFRRHTDPNSTQSRSSVAYPSSPNTSNRQAQTMAAQQSLQQRQTLSSLEAFIMQAQGDLASLEYSLEHPDMLETSDVGDCRRHLHRARTILEQYPTMSSENKMLLTNLTERLTEIINLHAAITGAPSDANAAERKRAAEMANSLRQQTSNAAAEAEMAAAIKREKEAIEKLIEEERKETQELRTQLEASRRSREELQGKYKEAKEKNKQLIGLVEEYGSRVDELEEEKSAGFAGVAAVAETKVVVQKPKVSKAVMSGINSEILDLRRGLRQIKEVHLKDLAKEMALQSVQIQGAIVNKLLESDNKGRRAEQQAMLKLQELYKKEVKLRKQYYNTIQELKGNIRVYCRVRPMSDKELSNGHTVVAEGISEDELRISDERGTKVYEFDNVFASDVDQEKVFQDTAPLIDSVVDGYNVCIFAYGQTGSGKTHTMQGGSGDSRGINRRALDRLFGVIHEREETEESTVSVSVLEIYCEQIRDLLVSKQTAARNTYDIKTGGQYGNYVAGLKEVEVTSARDVEEVLTSASGNRSEGQTDMNAHSSRSHMVLYIIIKSKNKHTGALTYGKLSLVDLAGSERLDKSNATGQGAKEAIAINKSLSALGDVIGGLSTGSKHIPFRNSQLTFLLQDSMSGQAKVLMFCCISPASYNVSESNSSLMFASRARGVSLGPVKKNQT